VDIVGLLESWGVSEKLINPLRDSHAGYIAVAYALYKIFTPLRYTVTLGKNEFKNLFYGTITYTVNLQDKSYHCIYV
jgi:Protein of unknown function (DUF1279).